MHRHHYKADVLMCSLDADFADVQLLMSTSVVTAHGSWLGP